MVRHCTLVFSRLTGGVTRRGLNIRRRKQTHLRQRGAMDGQTPNYRLVAELSSGRASVSPTRDQCGGSRRPASERARPLQCSAGQCSGKHVLPVHLLYTDCTARSFHLLTAPIAPSHTPLRLQFQTSWRGKTCHEGAHVSMTQIHIPGARIFGRGEKKK